MYRDRIVTHQRGSWRWQNAYRVIRYRVRRTRDGRLIWHSDEVIRGKSSMPQLVRAGFVVELFGSLHNVELTEEECAEYHGANEGKAA